VYSKKIGKLLKEEPSLFQNDGRERKRRERERDREREREKMNFLQDKVLTGAQVLWLLINSGYTNSVGLPQDKVSHCFDFIEAVKD
jgi:hypothetical protein